MVKRLDKDNFENILRNNNSVLVDFYTEWCGPCKMMSPIIDEVAEEREDVEIYKLNIEDAPEIAAKYNIVSIPTIIVFENGNEKARSVGFRSKINILNMID